MFISDGHTVNLETDVEQEIVTIYLDDPQERDEEYELELDINDVENLLEKLEDALSELERWDHS